VDQQLYDRARSALDESINAENAMTDQLGKVNLERRKYGAPIVKYSQVPTKPQPGFIGCPPSCRGLTEY
jgi:hypothetical protein